MSKKTLSRTIKISLLLAAGVYMAWFVYQVLDYTRPEDRSSLYPNEIIGIYHIHSHFSDGKKDLNYIIKTADQSQADFLILTDHGNLNLKSLQASGFKSNVLVLGGSELSLNRGHLVVMGLPPPFFPFSHTAEEAGYQIKQKKGFSVIAHPYSKNRWSWEKKNPYSGMEIINADSMLKSSFPGIIPYLPFLLIKPEITALKMLHSPRTNLMKWDNINLQRPFYGYYAADAHMFYSALFQLLRLHIPLNEALSSDYQTAASQIHSALAQGRFFNSIDGAADASGFRFWGENKNRRIPMGSTTAFEPGTILHIQLPGPQTCKARLIHNGSPVPIHSGKHIRYNADKPGFYRVEVYLPNSRLSESCPWILSNPIFFEEKSQ